MEHSFLCGQPAGTTNLGPAFGEMRRAWNVGSAGSHFYGIHEVGVFPPDDPLTRSLSIHSRNSGLM